MNSLLMTLPCRPRITLVVSTPSMMKLFSADVDP
jgi:hypothetical protein